MESELLIKENQKYSDLWKNGYKEANWLRLAKILVKSHTIGATKVKPSSLSSTPPCPGIIWLESFTPNILLTFDSKKSLICSITDKNPLITIKNSILPGKINPETPPIKQLATTAPSKPAQVLLGLMLGAIFGPPKYLPAKKAKISVAQTMLNIQNTIEAPEVEVAFSDNPQDLR